MRAFDAALQAHERAVLAADIEAAHEAALREDHERAKTEAARLDFEAALPVLQEWFGPDVEWRWEQEGDYLYDCIIMEADAEWDALLKLRAQRFHAVDRAGETVRIEIGDYRHNDDGYRYFSGGEVKSAADIGRYIKNALVNKYGS